MARKQKKNKDLEAEQRLLFFDKWFCAFSHTWDPFQTTNLPMQHSDETCQKGLKGSLNDEDVLASIKFKNKILGGGEKKIHRWQKDDDVDKFFRDRGKMSHIISHTQETPCTL